MARRRVTQQASGAWHVVAIESGRVSSVHMSRDEATATARELVHHQGGGQVVIESKDGETQEEAVE